MATPATAPATITGRDTLANVETLIATVVADWGATNQIYIEIRNVTGGAGAYQYSISVLAPVLP